MENYFKLGPALRRFVDELAKPDVGPGRDGAVIVRKIRPQCSHPAQQAWRWKRMPVVKAAIEERRAEYLESAGIDGARAWIEIARIAYFDHRKLTDAEGNPIPLHKLDDATVAAIAGIDVEELFVGRGDDRVQIGTLKKYRTWNKVDALKMILEAKRELVQRHELTGLGGGPLQSVAITTDDPLEAARIYQEMVKGS